MLHWAGFEGNPFFLSLAIFWPLSEVDLKLPCKIIIP